MRIYDEENLQFDDGDDDFAGYTLVDENSIFKMYSPEKDEETIASPIPENEQTVILAEAQTASLKDGALLTLQFDGESCDVFWEKKKVGSLKPAYIKKLKVERGGQCARVTFKKDVPPMVRLTFGEGALIPTPEKEENV